MLRRNSNEQKSTLTADAIGARVKPTLTIRGFFACSLAVLLFSSVSFAKQEQPKPAVKQTISKNKLKKKKKGVVKHAGKSKKAVASKKQAQQHKDAEFEKDNISEKELAQRDAERQTALNKELAERQTQLKSEKKTTDERPPTGVKTPEVVGKTADVAGKTSEVASKTADSDKVSDVAGKTEAPTGTPIVNFEVEPKDKGSTDVPKLPEEVKTPTVATSTVNPPTTPPKTDSPQPISTGAGKIESAPKTEVAKTDESDKPNADRVPSGITTPPVKEAPKTEAPKTEAPKTEAPKTEAPKTETSLPNPDTQTMAVKDKDAIVPEMIGVSKAELALSLRNFDGRSLMLLKPMNIRFEAGQVKRTLYFTGAKWDFAMPSGAEGKDYCAIEMRREGNLYSPAAPALALAVKGKLQISLPQIPDASSLENGDSDVSYTIPRSPMGAGEASVGKISCHLGSGSDLTPSKIAELTGGRLAVDLGEALDVVADEEKRAEVLAETTSDAQKKSEVVADNAGKTGTVDTAPKVENKPDTVVTGTVIVDEKKPEEEKKPTSGSALGERTANPSDSIDGDDESDPLT